MHAWVLQSVYRLFSLNHHTFKWGTPITSGISCFIRYCSLKQLAVNIRCRTASVANNKARLLLSNPVFNFLNKNKRIEDPKNMKSLNSHLPGSDKHSVLEPQERNCWYKRNDLKSCGFLSTSSRINISSLFNFLFFLSSILNNENVLKSCWYFNISQSF